MPLLYYDYNKSSISSAMPKPRGDLEHDSQLCGAPAVLWLQHFVLPSELSTGCCLVTVLPWFRVPLDVPVTSCCLIFTSLGFYCNFPYFPLSSPEQMRLGESAFCLGHFIGLISRIWLPQKALLSLWHTSCLGQTPVLGQPIWPGWKGLVTHFTAIGWKAGTKVLWIGQSLEVLEPVIIMTMFYHRDTEPWVPPRPLQLIILWLWFGAHSIAAARTQTHVLYTHKTTVMVLLPIRSQCDQSHIVKCIFNVTVNSSRTLEKVSD